MGRRFNEFRFVEKEEPENQIIDTDDTEILGDGISESRLPEYLNQC